MWDAHDGLGWWMVFGGLLWLALWAAVFYVAFALFGERRGESDAFETARRRYARGEITREEFSACGATSPGHDGTGEAPLPPQGSAGRLGRPVLVF